MNIRMKAIVALVSMALTLSLSAQTPEQIIKNRICDNIISQSKTGEIVDRIAHRLFPNGVSTDQCLMEVVANKLPSEKYVMDLVHSQRADGSWSDVEYASKSRSAWPAHKHNERLMSITRAYRASSSPLYGNKDVSEAIHKGIAYWSTTKPECPNWWYNEIGVPKVFAPLLLLMEGELTKAEMAAALPIIERSQIKMTGQNKVWLSGVVLIHSLITGDKQMLAKSGEAIRCELVVSSNEGIQPDYSFHQHGAQQQFGNYGLAFASSQSYWARMLAGTPYDFSQQQREYLRNYMLEGLNYTVWRGVMDVSACGRQLFLNAPEGKAASLLLSMINMIEADTAYMEQYENYIARNFMSAPNELNGMRHYWRSDYSLYRAPEFMVSVKMCSPRVIGGETTNKENLMGYYLADGATFTYRTGKEYDNIFPCWNWRRIPGVTSVDSAEPVAFKSRGTDFSLENKSEFVGGLEFERFGITAMDLNRDGVTARKGWFFTPDGVVCLGAEIQSEKREPLTTSIEQSIAEGVPTSSSSNLLKNGSDLVDKGDWVCYRGIGYVSLAEQQWNLGVNRECGDWRRVAEFYPSKPLFKDIFSLYIKHSADAVASEYAYEIIPDATPQTIKALVAANKTLVVANNANVQGVENVAFNSLMTIFYSNGSVTSKLFGKVSASSPVLLMLVRENGVTTLAVSDPTQKLAYVKVEVAGRVYDITLPSGEMAGSTKMLKI